MNPLRPGLFATWICSLSSHLFLGVWLGLALHVRLGLGRWPTPMIDKYTTAAFTAHFQVLAGTWVFAAFVAIPLACVLICFPQLRGSAKLHLCQGLVYGLGWAWIGLLAWIDPFRFVTWVLD